jgi:hypothetical protein
MQATTQDHADIYVPQFVHVPALSPVSYTDQFTGISTALEAGRDRHGTLGTWGYWILKHNADGTIRSGELPGIALLEPLYTINNPDSYVGPALMLPDACALWYYAEQTQ